MENNFDDNIVLNCIGLDAGEAQKEAVRLAVKTALNAMNAADSRVSVVLTNDEVIHEYNREYRLVDRATDVLSFPSDEGDFSLAAPPDGFIGDIMISIPRAAEQGAALGHSTERELMFLAVHGTLHLLGFDHIRPEDEETMLLHQRRIMELIPKEEICRLECPSEDELAAMTALAREARDRAYAPYSGFRVGACLKAASGKYYCGCNIENAAFSPTVCAERTALFTAVCAGERRFAALVIVSDGEGPTYPCGVCRQALSEFCAPWMPIVCCGADGRREIKRLGELLPSAFTGGRLGKKQDI